MKFISALHSFISSIIEATLPTSKVASLTICNEACPTLWGKPRLRMIGQILTSLQKLYHPVVAPLKSGSKEGFEEISEFLIHELLLEICFLIRKTLLVLIVQFTAVFYRCFFIADLLSPIFRRIAVVMPAHSIRAALFFLRSHAVGITRPPFPPALLDPSPEKAQAEHPSA